MDFISNQEEQIRAMMQDIGISSIENLFEAIPKAIRLPPIQHDDGISEFEGIQHMEILAAKNTFPKYDHYLGAGAYDHHVPSIVAAICSKSEFLTAYTPYQPEASQGMLQIIFEFQSVLCALTGMDVSNASVYDAASACAEALLMTLRMNPDRKKIVVAKALHPHYRRVIEQYLKSHAIEIITIPFLADGTLDISQLETLIDEQTAAVLLQYPNFLGAIDPIEQVFQKAKHVGAYCIICANPLVYGLYKNSSELGADIAVGDCQPFGISLQFGGPYAGYITCKNEFVRQLPGRIVGETIDTEGRRGFVLTLQAREQHIRREKATSNICTNQALAALASLVAMLWYGKQGIAKLALTNYQRASYLKHKLETTNGITSLGTANFFNEFAISFNLPAATVEKHFRENAIVPGLPLGKYFPELENFFLVAVTETKSKAQLDHYHYVAFNLQAARVENR